MEDFNSRGMEIERLHRVIHQLQRQLRQCSESVASEDETRIYEQARNPSYISALDYRTPQVQEFQEVKGVPKNYAVPSTNVATCDGLEEDIVADMIYGMQKAVRNRR